MRGFYFFVLGLLTRVQSSTVTVTGIVGENVTLPCRYVKEPGVDLDFCWGRGPVPIFQCSDTILSFVDGDVAFLSDHGYQLLGTLSNGDMSLTILNAQMSHARAYGCRVQIPGWFNDYKVNVDLLMEEAPAVVTKDYQSSQEFLSTEVATMETDVTTIQRSTVVSGEDHFKSWLQNGNVGRVAALFLLSVIMILVFIFPGRRFLRTLPLERLDSSPVENVYENDVE